MLQGEGPDWQDFLGIICLLIINSTISFIEENNAGNAAAALMAQLAPKTKVGFITTSMLHGFLSAMFVETQISVCFSWEKMVSSK